MHQTPTRQQLLRAIATLPDDWLEEALQMIQTLEAKHTQETTPPIHNTPTILERMGGMPEFLIHNGQLSDREQRRKLIGDRIRQRYGHAP